jgi:vesicle-associated membrane protein 7
MTIVYALVSVGGKNVLAEYTATSGEWEETVVIHYLIFFFSLLLVSHNFELATGNFPTVTRVLLAKIPAHDGQMTYQYDNYNFHYIVEGGVCFLCMSDQLHKHRIPYAFLNDMKTRFFAQYGQEDPLQAIAFSYNETFSKVIEERMNFYNSEEADKAIDNIGAVKSQIEDVKNVMVQNIEKVRLQKTGILRLDPVYSLFSG